MIEFERIILDTERLRLRWLKREDVTDLFKIFSDKKVMRYWSTPPMQEMQDARELLIKAEENYESKSALRFGLECKETLRIMGTCSLFNFHHISRRAEIGYILGKDHWGQGLMNEALHVLIDYAFNILNLHRLEADIDPRNEASRQSLLRLGFTLEGLLRERWIVNAEIADSEIYGLLHNEWKQRKAN